jgi:hypothetical protein
MKYFEALKIWNHIHKELDERHVWAIPRKGTPEHADVLSIIHRAKPAVIAQTNKERNEKAIEQLRKATASMKPGVRVDTVVEESVKKEVKKPVKKAVKKVIVKPVEPESESESEPESTSEHEFNFTKEHGMKELSILSRFLTKRKEKLKQLKPSNTYEHDFKRLFMGKDKIDIYWDLGLYKLKNNFKWLVKLNPKKSIFVQFAVGDSGVTYTVWRYTEDGNIHPVAKSYDDTISYVEKAAEKFYSGQETDKTHY